MPSIWTGLCVSVKERQMRLTAELAARVAACAGAVEPGAMPPDRKRACAADHERAIGEILSGAPDGGDVWIFAYGSLIWNPAFEFVERRVGLAHGWHRSFCLGWDKWFRGSAARHGLMLALDRGGQCKGVAFRLPPGAVEENLLSLVRREIRIMPHPFPARWVKVRAEAGPVRAVTFVIDRNSDSYVGNLSLEEVANSLARAVGRLGSMAEYLHHTVRHLEDLGLHDRHLWQLQEMVAERIEVSLADQ